jgi:CheY-like chemotaxis protein
MNDDKTASTPVGIEIAKVIPPFLWILLAFYIASWVIIPTVEAVRRGQGVELKMSEFTLKVVEQRLHNASQTKGSRLSASEAAAAFGPLADRIERSRRQLNGATVLWVDDGHPVQNAFERRAIGALGVAIDTARSTDEALALLDQGLPYDAVVTDLSRPGQMGKACYAGSSLAPRAGCELLARLRERCGASIPPTIVYTGTLQPQFGTPAFAFGMTNRVDQLMMLLLDAFERRVDSASRSSSSDATAPMSIACQRTPLQPLASDPPEQSGSVAK